MANDAIVFAMANPTPEVRRRKSASVVAVIATGRSDYPNQINNVLAFPGVFRGALDVRATEITKAMNVAASHALATVIPDEELAPDYVIPSVFNRDVTPPVAAAVAEAAERDGVPRRRGRDVALVAQRLERVQLGGAPGREDRRQDPDDHRGDRKDDHLEERECEVDEVELRNQEAGEDEAEHDPDRCPISAVMTLS